MVPVRREMHQQKPLSVPGVLSIVNRDETTKRPWESLRYRSSVAMDLSPFSVIVVDGFLDRDYRRWLAGRPFIRPLRRRHLNERLLRF